MTARRSLSDRRLPVRWDFAIDSNERRATTGLAGQTVVSSSLLSSMRTSCTMLRTDRPCGASKPRRRTVRYHLQLFVVPGPRGCSLAIVTCTDRPGSAPCRPRSPARRGIPDMHRDHETAGADDSPRPWRPNRRVLVKAAALFGALATTLAPPASCRTARPLRDQLRLDTRATLERGRAGRGGSSGRRRGLLHRAGELSVLRDRRELGGFCRSGRDARAQLRDRGGFGEPVFTHAAVEDGGRPNRDGRIFTHLVFLNGATSVRYRALDGAGYAISLPGFELVFIDATNGPTSGSIVTEAGVTKPTVISRAGWGANESLRFSGGVEIWPRSTAPLQR